MATMVPLNYIEITEESGHPVARVAGTRIRVSEIVLMHVRQQTPIAWIVENYEVLDYASVHAALAYYYSHQTEIDAEIDVPEDFSDGVRLTDLIEKARQNLPS